MANTYSQINIQLVFSVKGRENIILQTFRDQLHQYIFGILRSEGCFPLAVNGYKDHVHAFFELKPDLSVSEITKIVKAKSSKWINDNKFVLGHFNWQTGYGAFSYSRSQRNDVIQYLMNQEEHHKDRTFKEEYLDMLNKFEIEFDEQYVFEFLD